MTTRDESIDFYDATYGSFAEGTYAEIRRAAMGEDIGQNGWLTSDEHDQLIEWMNLSSGSSALDIACGSGEPTLRIARQTGCSVCGIDRHEQGIANANARAAEAGLQDRARFCVVDAAEPLPFDDEAFDAAICIDAINHLPERRGVLEHWRRVLKPGGRLVFTDPITVTGALTDEEMRIRSAIGFFLFVPADLDAKLLEAAGFEVIRRTDRTANMAQVARQWHEARRAREDELIAIEGEETFRGQQRFLDVTATLAEERRLSRFAFLAVRA